jgi:iron complex outermembrane receptor protein
LKFIPDSPLPRKFPVGNVRAVGAHQAEGFIMKIRLLALAAGVTAVFPVVAQQTSELTTEEIVVTATRFEQTSADAPIGVTTINRKQIEDSGAQTVTEVLSRIAGVGFRDNTGSPDWQVDLRGFGVNGDQNTLVLVDGLRINDNELNSVRWSSIALAAVERIEILRGGGSVLYGSGATGGVINIIMRVPRSGDRAVLAEAGAGSYDTGSVGANAFLAGDGVGLRATAQYVESDNYRDNNNLRQGNAEIVVYTLGTGARFGFSIGAEKQDLGLPGARTREQLETDRRGATNPGDYSNRETVFTRAFANAAAGSAEFAADLAYRKKIADALLFGGFTKVDTTAEVWTLAPRVRFGHRAFGLDNSLVAGIDWEQWDYASTVTGPASVSAKQDVRALYAQHSTDVRSATRITVGARTQHVAYEARDATSNAPYASGTQDLDVNAYELALRQGLPDDWSVYGRLGQSFRVATVDEIYSQFGGPLFDPEVAFLEPQTSNDREVGVERAGSNLRFRAALFHMKLENEIRFKPDTFENVNLDATERYGSEIDAAWNPSPSMEIGVSYAYTVAKFRDGTQGGVSLEDNNVPLVPRQRAVLTGRKSWMQGTTLYAEVSYVGTQYFDNDQTNDFVEQMPAYVLVDVRLAHQIDRLRLSATVRNLTDRKYFSYGVRSLNPLTPTLFNAYPAAERGIFLAAEYRFGD